MQHGTIFDFFDGKAALILNGSPPLWYFDGRDGNRIGIVTHGDFPETRVLDYFELIRLLRNTKNNYFYVLATVGMTDK